MEYQLKELAEDGSQASEVHSADYAKFKDNSISNCCRQNWLRINRSSDICISSKAAWITLLWCFGIGIIHRFATTPTAFLFQIMDLKFVSLIYLGNAISLCFYPLAGYLADNVYGKYKMIIRSLQILMISFALTIPPMIVFTMLLQFVPENLTGIIGTSLVAFFFYLAMNVSFVGFNANVIQFGMEQLHDSPADHQSLFIYWYVWIYYIVQLLIVQPWNMLSIYTTPSFALAVSTNNQTYLSYIISYNSSTLLFFIGVSLFGIIGLTSFTIVPVAMCVAYCKKMWFLINPAKVNPYKLVYKISRFARQHKVPINRSAFTYCEDEIPTGIDLAKNKYGGPYTTEEVEDVKAFYGILKILWSLGPVFVFSFSIDPGLYWLIRDTFANDFDFRLNHVISYKVYHYILNDSTISSLTVVILITLYICILRRFNFRYSPNLLQRIGLGILFKIMSLVSIWVIILPLYHEKSDGCTAITQYDKSKVEWYSYVIKYILPTLPRFLHGISNALLYTALYEFVCAQSPPSMKGLLIGLSFAIEGIFFVLGAALAAPFYDYANRIFHYCGVYYYGVNVWLSIMTFIVYVYYSRRYKYRQRDDICDVYRYAEDYYSNIQEEENY